MKIFNFLKSIIIRNPKSSIIVLVSLLALSGYYFFGSMDHSMHGMEKSESEAQLTTESGEMSQEHQHGLGDKIYSCPMHPQIRQPNEGSCPICGMDLVLSVSKSEGASDSNSLKVNTADRRLSSIKTLMVEEKPAVKTVKALGYVEFDESKLAVISAYFDGRIEKQFADYTGIDVKADDHLAVLYSPDIATAQEEYIQAVRSFGNTQKSNIQSLISIQKDLLNSSKEKLKELGMSPKQIKDLGRKGSSNNRVTIYSPIKGTIVEKNITQGQYFKAGQVLYKIADLSSIWIVTDILSQDASFIKFGQKASIHIRGRNEKIIGRVSFVSPVVNQNTRAGKVRIELDNTEYQLKPGEYVEVEFKVNLKSGSSQNKIYDEDLVGKYISPMHPQIVRDKPGKCPICGMDLVPATELGFSNEPIEHDLVITVPRDAILKVGRKSVVFVEEAKGEFKIREVQTGAYLGEEIVVTSGLEEFENIAVEGAYLLDSQMQLTGKTSLIDVSKINQKESDSDESKP